MKKLFTRRTAAIALTLLLLAVSASQAYAQSETEVGQADAGQGNQEANWVTALGLTPDQVRRIRAIRQQNRFEWQAAKQRVNQALRALDQAIYSDDASDEVIEERAREVAEAQAAEVRLRARTELGIRRVLTPQQLNTFRLIRQERIRAAQIQNRRLGNAIGPPAQGNQRDRNLDPLLNPRPRRGNLPRRIRP
jgi:Spy/CpxP family protein refolding chaperone